MHYQFKPGPYSSHTAILNAVPPRGEGKRVLDVGCGDGWLGAQLAERGYRVLGLERRGGTSAAFPASVELIHADLEQGLPPLPKHFDYILCGDILEHLRDPALMLASLRHVLAPGGRLIASLPNSGNLYFRLNILAGRFPEDDAGLFDRTHLHFYMWENWERLFRRAGWLVERAAPTGIPVGLAFPRAKESLPVKTAERVSYGLARLWSKLFAYQFVVTARPDVLRSGR